MIQDVEYFDVSSEVYVSLLNISSSEVKDMLIRMQKSSIFKVKIGISKIIIDNIIKMFQCEREKNYKFGSSREDLNCISAKLEIPLILVNHILKTKGLK